MDLFADQFWREGFGLFWASDAREHFDHVRVPFLAGHNINFVSTTQAINLDGKNCTNTARTQLCSTSCSVLAFCRMQHHKSVERALEATEAASTRSLSLTFVGYEMCYHSSSSGHIAQPGIANTGKNGAVARGYLPSDRSTPKEAKWRTVRIAQHELSHNYGIVAHCTSMSCVMYDEAGDVLYYYNDTVNIWCTAHSNTINSNRTRF